VVDDEAGFLRATGQYLKARNYTVLTAESPQDAMATAAGSGHVDLLFSDVIMPGPVSGIQLAGALRELMPELKVLLTTGFADDAQLQLPGPQLAQYAILQKPYRFDELARRIHAILNPPQPAERDFQAIDQEGELDTSVSIPLSPANTPTS
jgi:DNA-binding NtrC family response regulator